MNKELEQKAKEFSRLKYGSFIDISNSKWFHLMAEFAQQNTITLGTKLDENGEKVEEPTYCSGCEECSGDCWATDYAIIYQKSRTVKEWIEYAKELESLLDRVLLHVDVEYTNPSMVEEIKNTINR